MKVLQLLAGLSTLTCVIVRPLRWLTLIMVLLTFGIVILRYALNSGAVLLQESVMYLHGALFMLAIALGVDDNTHVRVDILYSRRSPEQQAWIDLVGHILFLLPVAGFMIWVSLPYVSNSWQILEVSSEVGGIPGVFLLKTLIPLTGALLFCQGLAGVAAILLAKLQ